MRKLRGGTPLKNCTGGKNATPYFPLSIYKEQNMDFQTYLQQLTDIVKALNLTDLDFYDGKLPEAAVREMYDRGWSVGSAAYDIATQGI